MLRTKLNRICDAFGCSKFAIPVDYAGYLRKQTEVDKSLFEAEEVVKNTQF